MAASPVEKEPESRALICDSSTVLIQDRDGDSAQMSCVVTTLLPPRVENSGSRLEMRVCVCGGSEGKCVVCSTVLPKTLYLRGTLVVLGEEITPM